MSTARPDTIARPQPIVAAGAAGVRLIAGVATSGAVMGP